MLIKASSQVVVVKSLAVPVLTITFSNSGTVRLAKILLVSISLRSNQCSGWEAHYVLETHTQI